MGEFDVLYRSLHRDQKVTKKVEKDTFSDDTKSPTQSEKSVNPLRALLAKIF